MKMIISNSSSVPIYEQIKNSIIEQIVNDELKEDEAIPSIRNLAKDIKISVMTIKKAYDELEQEGYIISIQGKGTFVAPKNTEIAREKALLNHKNLLTLKRNRLNKLIRLVDKTLKGDDSMSFSEFDESEIEKLQKEYADEAKEMYGNIDKYKTFQEKTKNYSKSDWADLYEKIEVIFKKFASVMDKGETSEKAQNLVKEWKNFISENLYNCDSETLLGLSKLYIDGKRFTKNIDKHKDGLADFISKSIQIYCK